MWGSCLDGFREIVKRTGSPSKQIKQLIQTNIKSNESIYFIGRVVRSNFNTRDVNTREIKQSVGHNFSGCGSYELEI